MSSSTSRDFVISFRLNGEEVAKIDKVRENTDRTRSDYCRSLILGHLSMEIPEPVKPIRFLPRKMPTYDRQQLSQILGQLGKIGSNINQISKHTNTTKQSPLCESITQIQTDITGIKKFVCNALYREGRA